MVLCNDVYHDFYPAVRCCRLYTEFVHPPMLLQRGLSKFGAEHYSHHVLYVRLPAFFLLHLVHHHHLTSSSVCANQLARQP
jgi:hypothetical protein